MITITKEDAKNLKYVHRGELAALTALFYSTKNFEIDLAAKKAVEAISVSTDIINQVEALLSAARKQPHTFERESLGSDRCKHCGEWEDSHGNVPRPEPTSAPSSGEAVPHT